MTASDLLVQRFLDQELSAEERVRFVVQLGRDETLRQRVIALERLLLDASRLPRPAVPDAFVARVMERIEPASSPWRKMADALWAPREITWNLATAGAAACVALLAVWGILAGVSSRAPGPLPTTGTISAAVATPPSPVLVRLVVLQPGAKTVQVAGDFNGWNPASTSLEQISSGAWTVTLPLEPGRYEYMFVVDGQRWIVDPFAAELNDDGFGSRNAVLEVRPPSETRKATL